VVDCIYKDSGGQTNADVRNGAECHYHCRYCGYSNAKEGLTRDHIMKKHLNYRPYSCSFCDFRAAKSISVMLHVRHKHRTVTLQKCSYLCHLDPVMENKLKNGYYSSTNDELADRDSSLLQDHTYNAVSSVAKTKTATGNLHQSTGSGNVYQCEKCAYVASGSQALKVHITRKHRKLGLICQYCDVVRRRSSDMFVHWYKSHKHLPFKYQQIGGEELATSDVSTAPAGVQTTMTVVSEFDDNLSHDPVSDISSSQSSTSISTLTHEITHTLPYGEVNDVIYCCEICPSSFSTQEALSSHECTGASSALRELLS